MKPYEHYVVCVSPADDFAIPSECLTSGPDLKVALHTLGVFLLFVPDATCSLYAHDLHRGGCVLRVEGGHWRVEVPPGWRLEVPAAFNEAVA